MEPKPIDPFEARVIVLGADNVARIKPYVPETWTCHAHAGEGSRALYRHACALVKDVAPDGGAQALARADAVVVVPCAQDAHAEVDPNVTVRFTAAICHNVRKRMRRQARMMVVEAAPGSPVNRRLGARPAFYDNVEVLPLAECPQDLAGPQTLTPDGAILLVERLAAALETPSVRM